MLYGVSIIVGLYQWAEATRAEVDILSSTSEDSEIESGTDPADDDYSTSDTSEDSGDEAA